MRVHAGIIGSRALGTGVAVAPGCRRVGGCTLPLPQMPAKQHRPHRAAVEVQGDLGLCLTPLPTAPLPPPPYETCPGAGHPMKPHRLALTNNLVMHYDLYKYMEVGC